MPDITFISLKFVQIGFSYIGNPDSAIKDNHLRKLCRRKFHFALSDLMITKSSSSTKIKVYPLGAVKILKRKWTGRIALLRIMDTAFNKSTAIIFV